MSELNVVVKKGQSLEDILREIEKEKDASSKLVEDWIERIRRDERYDEADEDYILEYRREEEEKEKNLNLVFDFSDGVSAENCSFAADTLQALKEKQIIVRPSVMLLSEDKLIEKTPGMMTGEELERLEKLTTVVRKQELSSNHDLGIRELASDSDLSLEDIVRANELVSKVAKKIKDANLSPFEAVLYAHNFCTSFFYNEDDFDISSREIEGLVNSGNIICVGYASLFKAILDEANISGLETRLTSLEDKDRSSRGGHVNNLVRITDPKYGIDGSYIVDTCYDSQTYYRPQTICCCLYPVQDVDKTALTPLYYSSEARGEVFSVGKIDKEPKKSKELIARHKKFIKEYSSSPIELTTYANGLFEMAKKTGMSEHDAGKFSDILIDRSLAQAPEIFKGSAVNCFSSVAKALNLSQKHSHLDPLLRFKRKKEKLLSSAMKRYKENPDVANFLKLQSLKLSLESEENKLVSEQRRKQGEYQKKNLDFIEKTLDE